MANALSTKVCACGKDCYPSKRAAASASRVIVRHKGGRELRPYRCENGAWHLTQQRVSKAARSAKVREGTQPNLVELPQIEYGPKEGKPRKLVVLPVKPDRKPRFERGPEHSECTVCHRRWLSDLDPTGRLCPGCGSIGTVAIGWADRDRAFIRSVAA